MFLYTILLHAAVAIYQLQCLQPPHNSYFLDNCGQRCLCVSPVMYSSIGYPPTLRRPLPARQLQCVLSHNNYFADDCRLRCSCVQVQPHLVDPSILINPSVFVNPEVLIDTTSHYMPSISSHLPPTPYSLPPTPYRLPSFRGNAEAPQLPIELSPHINVSTKVVIRKNRTITHNIDPLPFNVNKSQQP